MKTYEEMAMQADEISCSLYALSKELELYFNENAVPGVRPMNICYIAKETIRNMSFSLESLADVMLGN